MQHVCVIGQRRCDHPGRNDDCVIRCRAKNLGGIARRTVVVRLIEEVPLRKDEVERCRRKGKSNRHPDQVRQSRTHGVRPSADPRSKSARSDCQERKGREKVTIDVGFCAKTERKERAGKEGRACDDRARWPAAERGDESGDCKHAPDRRQLANGQHDKADNAERVRMRRVSEAHFIDTDIATGHQRSKIPDQHGIVVIPEGASDDAVARNRIEMFGVDVRAAQRKIEEAHGRARARDHRRAPQQARIGLVGTRHDRSENSWQRAGDDRMDCNAEAKDDCADIKIASDAAIEPAQQKA